MFRRTARLLSSSSAFRPTRNVNMKHHLMIGTWTPPGAIFTVQFDDETHELKLIKRTEIPEDQPISWMTFDHARKNIYGAGMKKWGSYFMASPSEITHHASIPMGGHLRANDSDTKTRAIFVLAAKKAPYYVYGNPFYDHAGFLNVHSVDSEGRLAENVQNAELDERSAIHGMVFDPQEEYLYSADMWANKIWTHKKKPDGTLELVGFVDAQDSGDHPRWVEISPSGAYLYVLMEAGNRLCIYVIDEKTHLPVYTRTSYPLIPPNFSTFHPKMYRSDVVFTSQSGDYLFATSRSNSPKLTGYIAAFKLGKEGQVQRQICLNPTPTSGGHSNAVSPCPWTDEWVALCDDEQGWVEIYRWKDEFLGRVAHLDIKEPGFGMNAIWYD
ncbi:Carboxy-cis,cis-muconate cyclase [Fulvia fulva]|nr:Carboxy-cis,cis-muconate cyclase [Fulvia fulva]WPV19707.1 Carboxy-cis,cis-muconate cyclase [Fulvia fulva]WPV34590.1 Carboxy-cis,cis-muconate cyclase [Fulvia fulva]